ncbi:nudC domain-containing protein 3 [Hyalella azteca]|uniref:NudC domain-containing protein 3 n=1 Tax=Hyalella azteca TaxID=294128 RepID=A0A8B7NUC0_HYAAZ|nr:nudC domain-containing protein 3 [Hyalella azteca]
MSNAAVFHSTSSDLEADAALNKILNSVHGSVPQLLDTIFAFLAKTKPDIFSSDGISLEHLVSQSLHKWRSKVLQEQKATALPHGLAAGASTKIPETITDIPTEQITTSKGEKNGIPQNNDQPLEFHCTTSKSLIQIPSGGSEFHCSNVAAEEIVTSTNVPDCNQESAKSPYSWSQTMEDLDIKVTVPSHVVKGKQVIVAIKDSSIYVALKATPETILLHGALRMPVDSSESLWDLTPGCFITLHLTKREALWWRDSALVGVMGTIEGATTPERDFGSMPVDEQADIRRIVFDAEQKAAGKPVSDTLKMESLLRNAWDAPGSPFKGQPFDLSQVNIVPQGPS